MQVATEVAMPGYGPYMANMAKRTKCGACVRLVLRAMRVSPRVAGA